MALPMPDAPPVTRARLPASVFTSVRDCFEQRVAVLLRRCEGRRPAAAVSVDELHDDGQRVDRKGRDTNTRALAGDRAGGLVGAAGERERTDAGRRMPRVRVLEARAGRAPARLSAAG